MPPQSFLARDAGLTLGTEEDALDVMSSSLPGCIFTQDDLHPDFLDLANGMAGAALQKFVNYQFPVALVIPRPEDFGPRVVELARDHASHPSVRFFETTEQAQDWLVSKTEQPR